MPPVVSPAFLSRSRRCSRTSPSYAEGSPVGELDGGLAFGLSDNNYTAAYHIAPLPQLAQSTATISKSPMTVSYTVEALTTIPSDGLSYKVLVATVPFEAVITHITTPRKSPIAYLQVRKGSVLRNVELT
jgi:hypothetical protein